MATRKKRSRARPGAKRGRPRKVPTAVAEAPSTPAVQVDPLIQAATAESALGNASTALDDLARTIEQETAAPDRPLTGPVSDLTPTSGGRLSDRAIEQFTVQVAGLSVVGFGLMALWRGPEWAASEEEAQLIADACRPYAEEAALVVTENKWIGPMTALLVIVGQKALAETERKHAEASTAARAPGTAPSDG